MVWLICLCWGGVYASSSHTHTNETHPGHPQPLQVPLAHDPQVLEGDPLLDEARRQVAEPEPLEEFGEGEGLWVVAFLVFGVGAVCVLGVCVWGGGLECV